jgi:hypothetical protein
MAAPRAKNAEGTRDRRPKADKIIYLSLEPPDHDITEQPSCCHVFLGDTITFKSKLTFTVGFNSVCGSPFVQPGTAFSGSGSTPPTKLDVAKGAVGKKFKYAVMLTDPKDPKKTYCDGDCPTIIVGELGDEGGSDNDS